jgi:hypothetical protein
MYKVAIPSYKRQDILVKKSLPTLISGKVDKKKIYIFVANKSEEKIYRDVIPKDIKIVVGKKGIANQRKFIKNYFKQGECIVSIDDDIQGLYQYKSDKLVHKKNIDAFFKQAFKKLKKEKLYIWGIYPVSNPFFMKGAKPITTELKFIIGCLYGFIVRNDKKLEPSSKAEGKEDYHQSILYYLKDGGVVRYNHMTVKTKFNAPGGLGTKRFVMNKKAATFLHKKYPEIVTVWNRPNGMTEIRIKDRRGRLGKKTRCLGERRRKKRTRKK